MQQFFEKFFVKSAIFFISFAPCKIIHILLHNCCILLFFIHFLMLYCSFPLLFTIFQNLLYQVSKNFNTQPG